MIVTCPECSKRLKLKSPNPGARIRCPGCSTVFVTPAEPVEAPPETVKSTPKEEDVPIGTMGEDLFTKVEVSSDNNAQVSAAVEMKSWNEHTCSLCGMPYRYLFQREFSRKGASEEEARETAVEEARRLLNDDGEVRPCPACGLVQPEMVGTARGLLHIFVLVLVVVAFLIFFALATFQWTAKETLQWLIGLTALGALVGHFLVERKSRNRDLGDNQHQSLQFMAWCRW